MFCYGLTDCKPGSIVAQLEMQVVAKLKQPFLTTKREVTFPLTQYGERSERFLTLSNPSDSVVVIDGAAFYNVFESEEDSGSGGSM